MAVYNLGMPGNTHVDQLIERGTIPVSEGTYLATMALAFEQHTANLIAYQANILNSYVEAPKVPRSKEADALNDTIKTRLGLK